MKFELSAERLVALPVQLIGTDGGVVIKRGRLEVKVAGENAGEVVSMILEAAIEGATREGICELFSLPERPSAEALVDHLVDRRILVPEGGWDIAELDTEGHLDVFYWHFGTRTKNVRERLNGYRFKVLGLNHISQRLLAGLEASGVERLELIDDPLLRNFTLFNGNGHVAQDGWPDFSRYPMRDECRIEDVDPASMDCLIAASDTGATEQLRALNEYCVLHGIFFFPVLLQDLVGYVGPLVVPGQTACFECLRSRQNAHLMDPASRRSVESALINEQSVSGFHPSMAYILGDIAAIELTKYFGLGPSMARVGTLIEVNLLGGEMKARRVLKLPRCQVCSGLNRTPSPSLVRAVLFDPGKGGEG